MIGNKRLSYEALGGHFLTLSFTGAEKRLQALPIFSGDLSVVLHLTHRMLKDLIETHFPALHPTSGKRIQIVHDMRQRGSRAMRGYLLLERATAQLILQLAYRTRMLCALLLVEHPAVLAACFATKQHSTSLLSQEPHACKGGGLS